MTLPAAMHAPTHRVGGRRCRLIKLIMPGVRETGIHRRGTCVWIVSGVMALSCTEAAHPSAVQVCQLGRQLAHRGAQLINLDLLAPQAELSCFDHMRAAACPCEQNLDFRARPWRQWSHKRSCGLQHFDGLLHCACACAALSTNTSKLCALSLALTVAAPFVQGETQDVYSGPIS
jgi:hypothetical protein